MTTWTTRAPAVTVWNYAGAGADDDNGVILLLLLEDF